MNIKTLIKKYEELWNEHSPFYEPVPYTSMVELFLKELKQLDEPKPVKVPQCVADWIEYCKARKITLAHALYHSEEAKNKSVYRWLFEESGSQEKFARAWLDGYEVEEEKKYFVKLKAVDQYLVSVKDEDFLGFLQSRLRSKFTRKELENANLGWVFDCPGVEIEEVEG